MRHPDEIKKFVKKNGTYMLKKSKSSSKTPSNESLDDSFSTSKHGDDGNPEDSGVDEPKSSIGAVGKSSSSSSSSASAATKRASASANVRRKVKHEGDEDEEVMENEEEDEDEAENIIMEDEADTMTGISACDKNHDNAIEDNDEEDNNKLSALHAANSASGLHLAANQQQNQPPHAMSWNELYPFMYSAQMAMFTRMMSNQTSQQQQQSDDPAQLFMNLR